MPRPGAPGVDARAAGPPRPSVGRRRLGGVRGRGGGVRAQARERLAAVGGNTDLGAPKLELRAGPCGAPASPKGLEGMVDQEVARSPALLPSAVRPSRGGNR